jgi:hypothetical protein
MNRPFLLIALCFAVAACQGLEAGGSGRCYSLKPWQLSWEDPDKLRQQVSHCVCETHIDLKVVKDASRYVVPGTELR